MRTINKYFYLLAAVALAGIVSCQKEKEEFKPGEPDSETCEGVYFIKQDVIEETQIFDPTQVKKDTIIVRRSNSDGALTVTPKVSLSEITSAGPVDGDATLFTVSSIEFKDGQEESYVAIEFPNVEEGVQYSLHLSIEGDEFSSKYSNSLKACDYKVMCVAYQNFCKPNSDEPAKVTFTSTWWAETHTAYIKYYEVDGIRHCVTYDEELVGKPDVDGGADGFWGTGKDTHFEFLWYVADDEECEACGESHPCKVPSGYDVPAGSYLMTMDGPQYIFTHSSAGAIYMHDNFWVSCNFNGYTKPFLHYTDANDLFNQTSYYDNNGGFFFYAYYNVNTGGSGWKVDGFDLVGIAEGYVRADYTVELTAGMPEPDETGENVVPIAFKIGADVDKVGYTILEGNVSSALIANEAAAIAKDTVDCKYATWVDANGLSFVDKVSAPATGMYTLVAVAIDTVQVKEATKAFDKDNNVKYEYVVKNTASVPFKYLKAGDAGQVVLNVDAATTANLASQGLSPETSLQYTISGAGITGAIPMVYSQAEIESAGGIDAMVEEITAARNTFYAYLSDDEFNGKLTAEQLASANDKGFTDIYSNGVTPGTLYYVIVWATNGYDVAVEYATMTTTGDPLPIYMTYTAGSYDPTYIIPDASGFIGTWNVYGVDAYGTSSLRTYLGKSVITASDTPTEGPDDSGFYDEYVLATGLLGDFSWLEQYGISGFDDRIELDVYAGLMYTCSQTLYNDNVFGDCMFMLYSKGQDSWGWDYAHAYWTCFIPVRDGYYAFVDVKYGDTYNFCGLCLYSEANGWLAKVSDQLLVDPAKDDNGVASAPSQRVIEAARANFSNCVVKAEESGLSGKRAIRKAIDEYKKGYDITNHFISIQGVKGLAPVQSVKRVEAGHNLSIAPRQTVKDTTPAQFSMRKNMK